MSEPVEYGPCRCTVRPSVSERGISYRVPGMFCRVPGHSFEEIISTGVSLVWDEASNGEALARLVLPPDSE